jgi:hypothetical protein
MCSGMANNTVELTAVLAVPAPVEASQRVLCSYRSGFEGCNAAVGRLAAVVGRFEGDVDGGPVRSTASGMAASLLMVNSCIEFRLDSQAYKSPVVVKGPFFPRVVNPRYRIRGTNV